METKLLRELNPTTTLTRVISSSDVFSLNDVNVTEVTRVRLDEQTVRRLLADLISLLLGPCSVPGAALAVSSKQLPRTSSSTKKKIGGAYRDRTDDPLLAKQMLSQLS